MYENNKKDIALVGDDPWEVFVTVVRAICILAAADVSSRTHSMVGGW
jgi:hypothetical protein